MKILNKKKKRKKILALSINCRFLVDYNNFTSKIVPIIYSVKKEILYTKIKLNFMFGRL